MTRGGVRDTLRERRIRGRLYRPVQAKDRCSNPQISISTQHRQGIFGVAARRRQSRENPTLTHCYFDHASARFNVYSLIEGGTGVSADYCRDGRVANVTRRDRELKALLEKWRFCARTVLEIRKVHYPGSRTMCSRGRRVRVR